MLKYRLLFLLCLLFNLSAVSGIHAEDKKPPAETKVTSLKRVYKFPSVFIYVLEDGYSLYHCTKSKQAWKKGDEILVQDPFTEGFHEDYDSSGDEIFVNARNLTKKKDGFCLRLGWTTPQPKTILSTNYKKSHGEKIVTITLDDNTKWRFEYFDETAHAKFWKEGEKVLLFVDTHDHNSINPLPLNGYLPKYSYEMFNIDNKHFMTGEPPKPVTKKK